MYDLIDKIRRRPAMYIGYNSPTHLHSFLQGFLLAKGDLLIKGETDFADFDEWVAKRLNFAEPTSGWAYMIEDQTDDKEEALWLFYQLLDEYRGIGHQVLARMTIDNPDVIDTSWSGYSRLKKVRGTFQTIEKPIPNEIVIKKIELSETWYELVAIGNNNYPLWIWSSNEIKKILNTAVEVFGIQMDGKPEIYPLKKS